jgi:hypothetical protein
MRSGLFVAITALGFAGCGVALTGDYTPEPVSPLTEAASEAGVSLVEVDARSSIEDAAATDGDGTDGDASAVVPPQVGPTKVAVDSLTIDHVRNSDGPIAPDGADDGVFEVEIVGPAAALAIIRTNADGTPCCLQQWDTWVGSDSIPDALQTGFTVGSSSYHVAIYEGGALRNDAAGRVALSAGRHALRLAASNVGSFIAGEHFRVVLQTPDGGLYLGPVVRY